MQTEQDVDLFPYGLLLWASATGLSQRMAEAPDLVCGKRVLELGTGVGLPGLVARHLGAYVVQTDYQEEALQLARRNAQQNGVADIEYLLADWRDFPDIGPFDLVLGSDILYERSLHQTLLDLLRRLVPPDGLLLLSDPIRPQAIDFIDRLEHVGWQVTIESREVDWEGTPREIALFAARQV